MNESEPDANGWYRPEVKPPKAGRYQALRETSDGELSFIRLYYGSVAGTWHVLGNFDEVSILAWRVEPETPKPEWIK